jgi:hypothetical protein
VDLLRPHLRLLAQVFATAAPGAPWALAGGYALQAHGLIQRPHANVDLATESAVPMPLLAESLRAALTAAGRQGVTIEDTDPLSAHLSVPDPPADPDKDADADADADADRETNTDTDTDTETVLRLALHKETFWSPPVATPYGPALAPGDAVGTKIRALYDRGLAVDLIDARAASARFTHPELEELARRHARDDFDLPTLRTRLEGTDHFPDSAFAAYGLVEGQLTDLRAWAQAWSTEIAERLLEEGASPDE